ncbi:DUF2177 family protein [Paracoccus litorisediminis]|jgi:uncharacterized membrane protein|uniref:DUF2177 family protein n=1 Tax=Paracoccus litorisediminis TaxID=2006130 RepID=A0A844HW76_9RHOB|nr:DUF2177 family protein [Paracoccus litorisediminis]MTH62567.1 DUF2177 family protein [Paracoccus litorisediminis]
MQTVILYLSTFAVFLVIDMVGISLIIRPIFERHVGALLADPLRLGPAAAFYAAYVAGMLYFVSLPGAARGEGGAIFWNGLLLGLMCYGTYEFTNLATLRDWSLQQVVVDTLWGGLLTGFSAWAGVAILRWLA